jgi:hypothetical protein
MLAKADVTGKPLYLVMDEENKISYVTGNGNRYPISEKPTALVLAYQMAEESFVGFPKEAVVHWLVDVHRKKLECLAREKGKSRDDVYRIVIAKAMLRETLREIKTHDDLKRRVSMEIRFMPQLIDDPSLSDSAEIISDVEDIDKLTPRELAQLFPAEKRYDGEKYQCKDYFTSAEFLNSLEDKPMGAKGVLNFLWDYMNPELTRFNLLVMKVVDNDRKRQGKPSMGEEFAKEMGIPLYTEATDADGNPVLMDEEGNTISLDAEGEKS